MLHGREEDRENATKKSKDKIHREKTASGITRPRQEMRESDTVPFAS